MTFHPPHISRLETDIPGAPRGGMCVAPRNVGDVSTVLKYASERDLVVQVWGGGTHSGYGNPAPPGLVMTTGLFSEVEAWDPDDLTIVTGAGAPIEKVEAMLAERNQSLALTERSGAGTIGGTVAAGISGLRRGRLYATRERVLEVTMVTGDGRLIRSGGRVVKNVTGYDLHRLAVGAFGALGVMVSICLKLWPTPPGAATVHVEDLDHANVITRPLAVLEHDGQIEVFLSGTETEVETQARRLSGEFEPGLQWPEDPVGKWQWSLRLPPASTQDGVGRLPSGWRYLAIHGVGEIRAASSNIDGAGDLRTWAESVGGHLVMTKGEPEQFDPWGTPPPGLELQRRLISHFDPKRIINPGRLPGGL